MSMSGVERNRKYYATARGRQMKRLAAARWYQRHAAEAREKKRARMHETFLNNLSEGASVAERTSRDQHDHHPNRIDGYRPRLRWLIDLEDNCKLKPFWWTPLWRREAKLVNIVPSWN